jgi:hypothetical protein
MNKHDESAGIEPLRAGCAYQTPGFTGRSRGPPAGAASHSARPGPWGLGAPDVARGPTGDPHTMTTSQLP